MQISYLGCNKIVVLPPPRSELWIHTWSQMIFFHHKPLRYRDDLYLPAISTHSLTHIILYYILTVAGIRVCVHRTVVCLSSVASSSTTRVSPTARRTITLSAGRCAPVAISRSQAVASQPCSRSSTRSISCAPFV